MFSQALKTQLVFALLLAMFMAWGGHAAAWLSNPSHHGDGSVGDLHAHVHDVDEQGGACVFCQLQHEHAPFTGDHLHETPYPTTSIKLLAPTELSQPSVALRPSLPDAPIFLIERPPRSRFVF